MCSSDCVSPILGCGWFSRGLSVLLLRRGCLSRGVGVLGEVSSAVCRLIEAFEEDPDIADTVSDVVEWWVAETNAVPLLLFEGLAPLLGVDGAVVLMKLLTDDGDEVYSVLRGAVESCGSGRGLVLLRRLLARYRMRVHYKLSLKLGPDTVDAVRVAVEKVEGRVALHLKAVLYSGERVELVLGEKEVKQILEVVASVKPELLAAVGDVASKYCYDRDEDGGRDGEEREGSVVGGLSSGGPVFV